MNKRVRAVLERAEYLKLEKESAEKVQAGLEQRKRRTHLRYLVLLGEVTPGVDATTIHDALVVALKFARAYRLDSPVLVGETSLLDLERRLFYESVRTNRPWLVAADGTLSEKETDAEDTTQPFDAVWAALEGSDQPITQEAYDAALSEIKDGSPTTESPYVLVPKTN
jgi:hypothetical protein